MEKVLNIKTLYIITIAMELRSMSLPIISETFFMRMLYITKYVVFVHMTMKK